MSRLEAAAFSAPCWMTTALSAKRMYTAICMFSAAKRPQNSSRMVPNRLPNSSTMLTTRPLALNPATAASQPKGPGPSIWPLKTRGLAIPITSGWKSFPQRPLQSITQQNIPLINKAFSNAIVSSSGLSHSGHLPCERLQTIDIQRVAKRVMEGAGKNGGTFHVVICKLLIFSNLQNGAWKVSCMIPKRIANGIARKKRK